jgi:hypothetical protein
MTAESDLPPVLAVIVTEPFETPVTRPVDDTVASPVLLLNQLTVRPVSTRLFAANTVAVSWTVRPLIGPLDWTVADAGVTSKRATGRARTVSVADPDLPPDVPVIVTVPERTVLTAPVLVTVAMLLSEVAHVTVAPVITAPLVLRTTALAVVPSPSSIDELASVTVT